MITKKILESTSLVMKKASHVKINEEKLFNFCNSLNVKNLSGNWIDKSPIVFDELSVDDYLTQRLTFNAISFSYWGKPSWRINYQGKLLSRASWSLLGAIERSKKEGLDISDSVVQENISLTELKHVLRGNVQIPLIEERKKILNEIGRVLNQKYQGSFFNMLEESNFDGENLLRLLVRDFSSFDDSANYKGNKIYFYKRAQALVESLESSYKFYPGLKNCQNLTALADYKIPVPLRRFEIISYSDELSNDIYLEKILEKRGEKVSEIRSSIIQSIRMGSKILGVKDSEFNDYFWLISTNFKEKYHLDRTTDY